MAAPIFNSKPTPQHAFIKAGRLTSAKMSAGRQVVREDHAIWKSSEDLTNQVKELSNKPRKDLQDVVVHLLVPANQSPESIRLVIALYESRGASVRMGAPTRYEREELV